MPRMLGNLDKACHACHLSKRKTERYRGKCHLDHCFKSKASQSHVCLSNLYCFFPSEYTMLQMLLTTALSRGIERPAYSISDRKTFSVFCFLVSVSSAIVFLYSNAHLDCTLPVCVEFNVCVCWFPRAALVIIVLICPHGTTPRFQWE